MQILNQLKTGKPSPCPYVTESGGAAAHHDLHRHGHGVNSWRHVDGEQPHAADDVKGL